MQNSTETEAGTDESRGRAAIKDRTDHAAQRPVITSIGGSSVIATDRDADFCGSNCQYERDRQREQFHGGYSSGREDATKASGRRELQGRSVFLQFRQHLFVANKTFQNIVY